MTKLTVTALIIILCFGLFSGCTKTSESKPKDQKSEVEYMTNTKATGFIDEYLSLVKTEPNFTISTGEENDNIFINTLFSSGMVLQRDRTIKVWGKCKQDGPIAATINGKNYYGECKNGEWEIYIAPLPAGGPYELVIQNEKDKKTISNIFSGDVYLVSGQSNMAMQMSALKVNVDYNNLENNNVHVYTLNTNASGTPLDTPISTGWKAASYENIKDFTATGFYFSNTLQHTLNIPIGIINASVGGSILSCWLPEDVSTSVSTAYQLCETSSNTPSLYYNGMIAPILNYQFAGVLWYQGEDQPNDYEALLQTLVSSWRKNFNQKYMTFSIVQLPRCGNRDAEGWYKIRQQQKAVALKDKNVTYSVNIDLGELNDIHPSDKQTVGERAAMATLSEFYGLEGTYRSPLPLSAEVLDGKVLIAFENCGSGLSLFGAEGFEVSQDANTYYKATAELVGTDKISLTCEQTITPKYVRHAYSSFPEIKLYNFEGYPCEQFVFEVK